MSFRRRVVLMSAGAVAAAIVLASALVYVLTAHELRSQVDADLRDRLTPGQPSAVRFAATISGGRLEQLAREGKQAALVKLAREGKLGGQSVGSAFASAAGAAIYTSTEASGGVTSAAPNEQVRTLGEEPGAGRPKQATPVHVKGAQVQQMLVTRAGSPALPGTLPALNPGEILRLVLPSKGLGGSYGYAQLVESNGKIVHSETPGPRLAVTAKVRAVAVGRHGPFFSDVSIDGAPWRVLTERAPPASVWQVAVPLTDTDNTLDHLRLVLAIVSLGGIVLAAALGLLVARAATRPVRRLTGAAERVARTQDLGHRIGVGSNDELGRLSASFNTMLAALERSRLAQRQLVSDASHELRTPLTSIQANLDALTLGERLPEKERRRVLAAAQAQLRELAVLVGDLVDLSKTEFDELEVEDVRLDLAAAQAIERARLHAPRCAFTLDAEPCLVRASPARLDRAIANLLDNAVKWGPPEGPVEVHVSAGTIAVRDHGPGIDPDDLPRVFDRFYRAPLARARPGSGLGLAIVRQAAEVHGGAVHAANDPGGGARLTLELPAQPLSLAEVAAADAWTSGEGAQAAPHAV